MEYIKNLYFIDSLYYRYFFKKSIDFLYNRMYYTNEEKIGEWFKCLQISLESLKKEKNTILQ